MKALNNISRWFGAIMIATVLGGALVSSVPLQTVSAASSCESRFLGFPAWFRGLTTDDGKCNIISPEAAGGLPTFIWHIGLNLVEIALLAVVYIATGYFLYGGFIFILSRGNPEKAATARMTLLYAMVGFIVSMAAVIIINFISEGLKK